MSWWEIAKVIILVVEIIAIGIILHVCIDICEEIR